MKERKGEREERKKRGAESVSPDPRSSERNRRRDPGSLLVSAEDRPYQMKERRKRNRKAPSPGLSPRSIPAIEALQRLRSWASVAHQCRLSLPPGRRVDYALKPQTSSLTFTLSFLTAKGRPTMSDTNLSQKSMAASMFDTRTVCGARTSLRNRARTGSS
jgi:hypothetical protein